MNNEYRSGISQVVFGPPNNQETHEYRPARKYVWKLAELSMSQLNPRI